MANINVKVGYTVDKTGLNEIKKQLTDLRLEAAQAKLSGNLTKDLEAASKAASQLEDILNSAWNNKLNQLDLSKVNTGIKNTYGNVQNLQQALVKSGSSGATAYNNFAMQVLNTNVQLKRASETLDKMAITFKNTVRYGISSSIFNNLSNSVQKAYNYTRQLDSSLNDIRIVTGKSADEMDRFAIRANKVAKDLGRSTKDFTEASLIYYQQGLGNEEAQARAEVTMKAANVTGQTGQDVSEQLTAVWNGYKVSAEETELYVDKLAAVAATTASDLEELSTGMSKVASAANIMGVDVDQLNAQLATIVSVTRQAPESVGTALKTIYSRMGDIEAGLDDEVTLGHYTEEMAQYGIEVLDANGHLRDMGDVIEEIGGKWTQMSREQQIALSQTMAGTRQYNNLLSLFDNWDMYTGALETSANAAGTLQKQQDIYMESTEAHLKQLSTEAERTYDILFDQDTVNGFADALTGVLEVFNNLLAGLGGGTKDFVFFGSTVANIFNKQIGESIERQIENVEAMRANLNREELQRQIIAQGGVKGEGVTNAEALEKEISYAEKTLQLQKYLTEEQAKQFTDETAQIGLLEQRIQGITQYSKIAEKYMSDYISAEEISVADFEAELEVQEENLKIEKEKYKNLKNELDQYQKRDTFYKIEKEAQEELTNKIKEATKNKEDQTLAASALAKIEKDQNLDEEEIKFILGAQRDIRDEQINTVNELKIGAQGIADVESGVLVDLQNEQTLREKNLQTMQAQAERQARISQIVQGMTSLLSLLTSLNGIIQTLGNDDLSIEEKTKQIVSVLMASLPIIIMNFSALSSLIPNLVIQFGLLTAEEVAAATAAGTLGTAIWGALTPLLPIILPIVGAIGLLTAGVITLINISQSGQKEIDGLRNAAESLSEQAEETKSTIDSLKDSLDGYSTAIKTLQACTEGTDEWNTALQDVNNTVLDILEKYPQLAKVQNLIKRDSDTGLLSIDNDILKTYQRGLEQRYITQRAGAVTAYAEADRKQAERDSEILLDTINTRFRSLQQTDNFGLYGENDQAVNFLTRDQLAELSNNAITEDLYNTKVKEFADQLVNAGNITKSQSEQWVSTMDTYREKIVELNTATENAANEMSNAAQVVAATALGPNATGVQQQLFANEYRSAYQSERDRISQTLSSGFSRFSGTGNTNYQDILKQYNAAMGNETYAAAHGSNPVRGSNGQNGIYFWNRETQQDEKLDREVIIDAIAAYNAAQTAENKKTYDEAATVLQKVAEAGSIDEDLADKVLSKTFDVNELTEDEYNKIQENKDKIEAALTDDQFERIGQENAEKFTSNFENALNEWDPEQAAQNAQKRFESSLEAAGSKAEKLFGLDAEEFQEFGQYLADIADESDKLADSMDESGDATAVVTQSILRMNKGIESLSEGWEEWADVLSNSSKESEEYWEALVNTQNALVDLLDTTEDVKKFFDDDFIKENAEDIEKAADGDADAIDRLKNAALEKIVLNIELNDSQLTNEELLKRVQDLQTMLDGINPNIEIGATINDASFIDACNHMIESANLTKEQANAIFGQMGFQAHFATEEQPTTYSVPIYTTYVRSHKTRDEDTGLQETGWVPQQETMTVQTGTETLTGEYATFAMSTSTPDGGGGIPKITGLTKKAGGSMSNYSSANRGGNSSGKSGGKSGGGGGSGGSAKQPDTMDPVEKEIDRYHDVDIQLKQIKTDMDKLDKQKKKLFGADLIQNLNKQLSLLDKQIDKNNEKIGIARDEAAELRDKLSGKGVSFNADGTIANYAQVYAAQLNYVNSLIAQYNSMSAEAQEGFKETVDNAKESFDKFVDDMSRYDEVVTNLIPDLEADIQSAVDEKIDLQIEKFDMEIELRLDLAEAERDWNEFKKKIIDGIEDDDILGNAMARLVDFSSYYKEDNTGIVQALRKQVDNTLAELNQMDNNGWSNVYGDNRTAALDDLKKYYEELMKNLQDVLELQEEIHESYLDMMDEAQDKFDEQIDSYEMISELIEHDMNVISLIYGDEAYTQLSRYYDKQQDNYNNQLDFQRQQVDFWRQQLDALEEGSDAWESAKEKWADAVKDLNDLIEESIENLQDKYLNAINLIFQNLNNQVTDGLGLDYIEEEWNLINQNADQYLDTINSLYEVQKLESKYLDALDNTDSVSAQRQLKEIMDEELSNLRERDKLTEYDVERANKRYEIALKQIALQEAQQNKTKMRLRRDSQGNYRYEYVSDADQVGQLQDELNDMYNSLYNFDKARYQDNLNQLYSVWVEFQEKMAEAAQINDPVARSERELLLQNQYEQLINGLTEQNATVRENLHESAFDDLSKLYDIDVSNFQNMSDEEKDVLMSDLLPYWESGVQHMADVFAGDDGFLGVCKDAFDQLHDATKDYQDGLDELENTGRIDFESLGEGIDENIDRTQQLINDNTELINSYENELAAIGNVIGELDNLIDKYNSARDAAVAATKAAYEYWSGQQKQAAAAAGGTNQGSNSNNSNSNSGNGASGSGSGKGGAAGDGNLIVGETATYSGSYYYDSYGSGPSGSKYSGVADGIVVDRITSNPYGIHIHSADGRYRDLGWIKKSQLSGYDTGGYTGEWGKDGRLALLHQKELVLNKEDTANMLNAISIMRNITNILGSSVLGKLAAATAGNFNTSVGNDVLEQNVHIDAQFPNVKDSREIEDALNNLVNMASMRANRK